MRPSDYALALALLSVGWLPFVNGFMNYFVIGSINNVMEMNRDFGFVALQTFWTAVLGPAGFVLALVFAWTRLRSRLGFCILWSVLVAFGLSFCLLELSGAPHPLFRSVDGQPMNLAAYWTEGGGLTAAALTTGPLLGLFLFLFVWERKDRFLPPTLLPRKSVKS